MQNWFSAEWFSWSKLNEINWARPYVLYLLLGIPILFFIRAYFQNRSRVGLPIATINGHLKQGWSRHFRILPPILIIISLSMMILAFARPQISSRTQNKISEGIDIILAIDISHSMLIKDILPNRLEASKRIAKQFINNRYQDRIGLVLFSGEAFSLAPLTTDYEALNNYIDEINSNMIHAEGTAIGSALAVGVNRLLEAKSKSKIIILISDGDNTAGNLDPTASAQIAKAYSVKLYTILVGAEAIKYETDSATVAYNMSIDQEILSEIAKIADGKFFKAANSKNLKNVFDQINQIEKVTFLENSSLVLTDVFHIYLKWGIVFWLLSFATKITFIGNILED
ncbi:MAG: VWA domain-containing protein [Bacteroidota bacterium]